MATYYVDTAVGNDANAGTSEGAGNAWATMDKAANTVAANDKVWVKASGNYNETVTLDTAGTVTTPILWEGYTSTTGDGGQVTVDAQSTRASCLDTSMGAGTDAYNCFTNFRFTGATGAGVNCTLDHMTFRNCRADNNATNGFGVPANFLAFENCTADNNTQRGFYCSGSLHIHKCVAHSNTMEGIYVSDGTVSFTVGYNNADHCFRMSGTTRCFFINCTADGDGYAGQANYYFSTSTRALSVVNCISVGASGAGSYGYFVSNSNSDMKISMNNLAYDNETNYSGFEVLSGELTSDPSFTNQAGDDYSLASDSPCIEAGSDLADMVDVGAYQYEKPAGGATGGFIIGG